MLNDTITVVTAMFELLNYNNYKATYSSKRVNHKNGEGERATSRY